MSSSTRWLWFTTAIALLFGAWSFAEVIRLNYRLHRTVMSDMIVVPARMDLMRFNAGIGSSKRGDEIALWLGRLDSNAQTRLAVSDGGQILGFYDKRGKLRLSIGIDATGEPQIRFIESNGKAHFLNPNDK